MRYRFALIFILIVLSFSVEAQLQRDNESLDFSKLIPKNPKNHIFSMKDYSVWCNGVVNVKWEFLVESKCKNGIFFLDEPLGKVSSWGSFIPTFSPCRFHGWWFFFPPNPQIRSYIDSIWFHCLTLSSKGIK